MPTVLSIEEEKNILLCFILILIGSTNKILMCLLVCLVYKLRRKYFTVPTVLSIEKDKNILLCFIFSILIGRGLFINYVRVFFGLF